MAKYGPLRRHLESLPGDEWRATFSEIEAVLGASLPPSARNHQAWWSNDSHGSHSHARAWLEAGWKTARLNLEAETVEFHRESDSDASEDDQRFRFRPDRSRETNEYDRLHAYLESFPGERWEATFSEVEAVLGEPLPYSARQHRPWWSNGGGHPQTRAWRSAGWKTARVALEEETLEFRRDLAPTAGPPIAETAEEDGPSRSEFRPVRSWETNRYGRLRAHLESFPGERWETTFSEVEAVLGEPLPYSARKHRPWWSNGGDQSQTRAWRSAGWKTARVNLEEETLEFRRDRAPAAEPFDAGEDDPSPFRFRPDPSRGRNRYDRLRAHLESLPGDRWETTFSEVEAVLGEPLPYSARRHRPWWSNGGGHIQTRAWRGAGWKTAKVNLQQETLEFRREFARPPRERTDPPRDSSRPEPESPSDPPPPDPSPPEPSPPAPPPPEPSPPEPPPPEPPLSEPEPQPDSSRERSSSEPGLSEVARIARRIAALPPDRWLAALREARAELDAAVLAAVRERAARRRSQETDTPEASVEDDAASPTTGTRRPDPPEARRGEGGPPPAPDPFRTEPVESGLPDPDRLEPPRSEPEPAAMAAETPGRGSRTTGEALSLGGVGFHFVAEIRPAADANGLPVEERPHLRFDNARGLPLNRHGDGPFCRFSVSGLPEGPGVYAVTVARGLAYVGIANDLRERWSARGYARIHPRNCFRGGQSTNCKVNRAILTAARGGRPILLWIHETASPRSVEERLIRRLEPPWNDRA